MYEICNKKRPTKRGKTNEFYYFFHLTQFYRNLVKYIIIDTILYLYERIGTTIKNNDLAAKTICISVLCNNKLF
jgi:hypothetical protein